MAVTPDTARSSASGTYTRKSSGLVREVGVKEVIALSAGFAAIGFLFFSVPAALGVLPNGSFTWPIIGASVSWVFTALAYWQLTSAMPRSGGDYVYASRVFGPTIGAMVGLGLLLALMFIFYVNCQVFINPELSFGFWALSGPLSSPSLASFATTLETPTGTFVGTLVMIVHLDARVPAVSAARHDDHLRGRHLLDLRVPPDDGSDARASRARTSSPRSASSRAAIPERSLRSRTRPEPPAGSLESPRRTPSPCIPSRSCSCWA